MSDAIVTNYGETGYIEHEFVIDGQRMFLVVIHEKERLRSRPLILKQDEFTPLAEAKWVPEIGQRVRIQKFAEVATLDSRFLQSIRESRSIGTIKYFSPQDQSTYFGSWYVEFDASPKTLYPFWRGNLEPVDDHASARGAGDER